MKKVILYILGGLILIIIVLFTYVELTWNKKFEAPYPEIKASTDSAVIARGKYLAFGPAHCATCHAPMDKILEVENGLEIPLSGGWELEFPGLGVFRAPNLTPDPETGIGKLTDGDIARTLRHSVGSDGRLIFPFMTFQGLSDEDVTAAISFLRSQPPVKHDVKRSEYGFMGKALIAFGLFLPEGPKSTPERAVQKDSTAAYGKYIAYHVADCRGCHTEMDLNTGKFVGPDFAGGTKFPTDAFSEGYSFVTPNLTPDKSSVISQWSEEAFIAKFRAGRLTKGTPMPWGAFSRMDETDLKAVYRYLSSLEPIARNVGKTVYSPGEELPK